MQLVKHGLRPTYRQLLKKEVVEKQIQAWENDSIAKLQGCFDCATWSVFEESSADLNRDDGCNICDICLY
jgi:hypothetical protein